MFKFLIICINFIIFFSCSNSDKLHIVTDDIYICDAVNLFNSQNEIKQIKYHYINNPEKKSIFELVNTNNYDIVAGTYIINENNNHENLSTIHIENDKILNNINSHCMNFYELYNNLIPYRINFPVISVSNTENYFNDTGKINLYQLKNISNKNEKIIFHPKYTELSEIDYLFLFKDANKIFSDSKSDIINIIAKGYSYYNNFGIEDDKLTTFNERYKNIDNDKLIKNDILKYNILPLTKALSNTASHKISMIENLNNSGLNHYIIGFNQKIKSTKTPEFIDFILSSDTQNFLTQRSISVNSAFKDFFIPINNKISKDGKLSQLTISEIQSYYSKLNVVKKNKTSNKDDFFNVYNYTKEMIKNERINEKDFLNFLSKNLFYDK